MQDRALQTTFDRLIKVPRAGDEKSKPIKGVTDTPAKNCLRTSGKYTFRLGNESGWPGASSAHNYSVKRRVERLGIYMPCNTRTCFILLVSLQPKRTT